MTEEHWNTCQSGTLRGIAESQRNRNTRRYWLAKSLAGVLILIVPTLAIIAVGVSSISCQQAVAWFDSAQNEKLTAVESRRFKFHLLTCEKCRASFALFKQRSQASIDDEFNGLSTCCCRHVSCSCSTSVSSNRFGLALNERPEISDWTKTTGHRLLNHSSANYRIVND